VTVALTTHEITATLVLPCMTPYLRETSTKKLIQLLLYGPFN